MAPEATSTAPGAAAVVQLVGSGNSSGQVAAGVPCPDEAPLLAKPMGLSLMDGAELSLLEDPCDTFLDLTPISDAPASPSASDEAYDGPASPRAGRPDVLLSGHASADKKRRLAVEEESGRKRAYRLVRLDEATGAPARPVTSEELQELKRILDGSGRPAEEESGQAEEAPPAPPKEVEEAVLTSPRSSRLRTLRHRSPEVAEDDPLPAHHHLSYNRAHCAQQQKPGGPCDHCGTTESPQWRRGPDHKPVLCNACGTRYRRTHQLGLPASQVAAAAAASTKCGSSKSSSSQGSSAGTVMLAC